MCRRRSGRKNETGHKNSAVRGGGAAGALLSACGFSGGVEPANLVFVSESLSKISRCAQRREIFSPDDDYLTRHTLCLVRKSGEVWRKKIRHWTCREILDRL